MMKMPVLIREIYYFLCAGSVYLIDLAKRNPQSRSEKPLIVFVHGLLENSSAFFFWRKHFLKEGLGPIFTFSLGYHINSPIEYYSTLLANKIKEAAEKTKQNKVHLIGHSMGGLVALECALHSLEKIQASIEVIDVVTLGSPLEGTEAAHKGLGRVCRQMEPGSIFLKNLKEKISKTENMRFFLVGSRNDPVIKPESSAFPDISTNVKTIAIEDLGHIEMLFNEDIMNLVIDFIKTSDKNAV